MIEDHLNITTLYIEQNIFSVHSKKNMSMTGSQTLLLKRAHRMVGHKKTAKNKDKSTGLSDTL